MLVQTSSCFPHLGLPERPKSGGCLCLSERLWFDTLIIRPSVIDFQIVANARPCTQLSLSTSISPLWWPLLLRRRYWSRGGCGGFAKEDIYENLPWSLSKKSLKDMKERAAIQCMEKTQWESGARKIPVYMCIRNSGEGKPSSSLWGHQTQKRWRETLVLVGRYWSNCVHGWRFKSFSLSSCDAP